MRTQSKPTYTRNPPLTLRQRFFWLGLVTAFWVCLASIFIIQMVAFRSDSWTQALRSSFPWLLWILVSPGVLWITQRFPFEPGLLRWSIPIHVATCVIVVFGCAWLSQYLEPPRPPDRPPPWMRKPPGPEPNPPITPRREGKNVEGRELGPPPDRPFRPRGHHGPPVVVRASFNLPIYFFLVSVGHAFTYFRRSRERELRAVELEASLAQAKLQSLRMQLHPHFLFNTLNAISTLVHKDPQAADEMIGNLSELLRLTIEDPDQQEIPLRKEMDFLNRYLEIQQVRFGDRLRVEQQIDPNVLAAQVPAMILQPLVENAIRHGLEPQTTAGIISIVASRIDTHLALSVRDTGSGATAPKVKPEREGIGLANTRARLQELYGNDYRFSYKNAPQGGFVVDLEIPYHEQ